MKALPSEGKLVDDLKILGILLENAHERFKDCVVFPVFDVEGRIVTLYGRSLTGKRHIYLPDRPTGLFNVGIIKTYPEIILVESVIDALSLEMAGMNNVVSIQGTYGFKDADLDQFKEHDVEKIILLLDGDDAGGRSSADLLDRLEGHFNVRSLTVPDDMDPNDYLIKNGSVRLPELFTGSETTETGTDAGLTNDENPVVKETVKRTENGFIVTCGLRNYEIIGLEKKQRNLKATIRVEKGGKIHVDTIDFYSSRMRKQLSQDICLAFEELPETVEYNS